MSPTRAQGREAETVPRSVRGPGPGSPTIAGGLLLALGLLSAFAPFAMDMYLPAFPGMMADLGTSAAGVQLSLTAFLVGCGVGQVVFGPLSDRYGRRRPLILGSALCVVASLAVALAPSITMLVVARVVQGLTGAAGMVVGRAVVGDLARGRAAARAFSLMMLVGGIAPVVAPLIGGLLVDVVHWRGLLMIVFGVAVLMFVAVLLVVPESHPAERRAAARQDRRQGRSPLLSAPFISAALAFGFAFSALMAYISASPFVFQVMIGLDAVQYALMFGVISAALTATGAASARLSRRVAPGTLLTAGLVSMLTGAVVLALLVAARVPSGWLAAPLLLVIASLGLVMGNGTALALDAVPHDVGKGSAVLGALQFGLGAVVSPLVGLGGEHTAAPLAAVLLTVTAIALVARLVAARLAGATARRGPAPGPTPEGRP